MPKVGLTSIIDKGFINSFLGLSKGKTSGTDLAKAINGGGSSKPSFSDGLRLGARAFGNAVQNLNSLTNFVGIAQGTLRELSKLTDSMIGLTEKATKSSTGFATRKRMITEFQDLAREFKKITKNAKIGERELLDAGDLETLFMSMGLDKEGSESVAQLFSQFIFEGDEKQLASENAKGIGFMKIPSSAFVGPTKKINVAAFTEEQLTNSAPTKANITASGAVSQSGSTVNFSAAGATSTVQNIDALFNTDSLSGYSVVASQADYLGYNTSGVQQLFVFDSTGQALQQLTNNQNSAVNYLSADISSDGRSVAFVATANGSATVGVRTVSDLQSDPALGSESVFENSAQNSYSNIKISSDSSHLAYQETDATGDTRAVLKDVATGERNNTLYQLENQIVDFDFGDTNAIITSRVSGASTDIVLYGANNTSTVLASNLDSVRGLVTVEKGLTSNQNYYFGFIDDSREHVELYREGRGIVARSSFSGETLESLSLTTTVTGTEAVTMGVKGVRPSITGDADSELYRLQENGTQTLQLPTRLAAATQQTGDILNSAHKLLRKPDAFRLLHDLKGLKTQIDNNFKGLESARELIQNNIELVRVAGFTFLDLSDQIGSADQAEDVARKLRNKIRKAPGAALAQAENLESIAVAALTIDEDDAGLDS